MPKRIIKLLINTLFPFRCLSCGELTESDDRLCDYCHEKIETVPSDKLCTKCCCVKKECECKFRTFHFDGCTAPFFNIGAAREIVYRFKFNHKESAADFLAERMTLSVKMSFWEREFDYVCAVPMRKIDAFKRGYNQSEVLAEKISRLLDIKYLKNALGCRRKKNKQHELSIKGRFENVKGVYFAKLNLSGKSILLVDDIKTTGATLDQCAKQLLKAGADRVYCVTALTTAIKKSEKGNQNGN